MSGPPVPRLGAGRSQVQILSPRLKENPAQAGFLFGQSGFREKRDVLFLYCLAIVSADLASSGGPLRSPSVFPASDTSVMDPRGAYPADRAAALSGVPKSTIHWWAREEILVPSVSRERVKLWSYSDLLGLRTIAWLRATKTSPDGYDVPATAMKAVRRALRELRELELELWTEERSPNVGVDRRGQIVLDLGGEPRLLDGQQLLDAEMFDVLRPFEMGSARGGPDLVAPRPRLRIVPGKLAGAPHVYRTRIETEALAALRWRGLAAGKIVSLYPVLEPADVDEALDLEQQLQPDLALAA
jgi:uncharacterized protein (DUF433 family)